ncbi:MAG: hypothetical protein DMD30_02870 [Gemmatimonadetes bacterium]|nr:MAG: hypothetical protein DMD30_02870 [Gemmatimonadota bacterium]PYP54139.1 MAG: hypothetical protein DMD39_02635 [Gemmatimonadota bacterium]
MTPGAAACASAAAKIHPRTIPETRLPTLSFPVVEKLAKCNRDRPRAKIQEHPGAPFPFGILTDSYAGRPIIVDYFK